MIELYESNPHKMTTAQEKAQCVSWFIETKSDVQTQRNYRSKYGRDPPSRPSIRDPPSRPSIRKLSTV